MKKTSWWIGILLITFVIYHVCYGLTTLYPTNINWLMSIRHDWGTHYLGWAFFKNEPWQFPLGKISNYNYPVGTNVGFTDSIPLLAIFFKLFKGWLPEDFQYYGLWLFVCHLLTGWCTYLLCKRFKLSNWVTLAAIVFMTTNPVLVYRAMHPALCAQWLLLGSIYLYFLNPNTNPAKKILWWQFLLLFLSAAINPYLCWMVLGFAFITPLKLAFIDKTLSKKYFFLFLVLCAVMLLVTWYLIGMIEFQKKEDLSVGGSYGLYALNLNSLINSSGYSRILPALQQVSAHQYEGFMYLGFGMMMLVGVALAIRCFRLIKPLSNLDKAKASVEYKTKTLPLVLLTIAYAILAITFVLTWNEKVLVRIPAPKIFVTLIEIFRANSRFFWIPYYLLTLFTLVAIAKSRMPSWLSGTLIIGALIVQVYDTKPLLTSRRNTTCCSYSPPMQAESWIKLMQQFDEILCIPAFTTPKIYPNAYQDFSFLALKAGKPINLAYVARQDAAAIRAYRDSIGAEVESGKLSPRALYLTDDGNLERFSLALQSNAAQLNTMDRCYYIYSTASKTKVLDELSAAKNERQKDKLDSAIRAVGIRREFLSAQQIPALNTNAIRFNAESVHIGEQIITMKGWAFIDTTQDNHSDSIFVTLSSSDKSYLAKARTVERSDMATFKRRYLNNAGFEFLGFTDSVERGTYQLGLAIKNSNGAFAYQPIAKEVKIKNPEYETAEKIDSIPTPSKLNYDLQLSENEKEIALSGWAAIPNQGTEDCDIFIIFQSSNNVYRVATHTSLRPDVTSSFKNRFNLDRSGYTVKILKDSLERGEYIVGILVRDSRHNKEVLSLTEKEVKIK